MSKGEKILSINFESVLNFIRAKDKSVEFRVKRQDDFYVNISEVISDSRDVTPGTLFACIKGESSDGHEFAKMAKAKGACALLCEREVDSELPQIIVKRVRDFLGETAALVYDNPASKLLMVGVTGTNGKTTTTYITRSILKAAGIRSGLLGTIIESDGIIDKEAAIPACKVMLVCPSCKKATRLAHKFITAEGKKPEKVRVCKKCGATIK